MIVAVVFTLARSGGPRSARWRLVAWSLLGTAAGAVAGTPAFVLRTRAVVAALSEQSRLYANPALFTADGPGPPLFAQAFLRWELGFLLPLLGAAGAVALLVRRETRTMTAGWAAFAAVFLAPALAHAFQPFRYALPLVPPLVIAAAALLAREAARFAKRNTAILGGAVAALVLSFVPGLVTTFQVRGATIEHVGSWHVDRTVTRAARGWTAPELTGEMPRAFGAGAKRSDAPPAEWREHYAQRRQSDE